MSSSFLFANHTTHYESGGYFWSILYNYQPTILEMFGFADNYKKSLRCEHMDSIYELAKDKYKNEVRFASEASLRCNINMINCHRQKYYYNICAGVSGEKLPPKWKDIISKAEVTIDFIVKDGEIEIPSKLQEVMGKYALSRLELTGVSRILSKIRRGEGAEPKDITVGNAASYALALEAIRYYNGGLKKTTKSVKAMVNDIGRCK